MRVARLPIRPRGVEDYLNGAGDGKCGSIGEHQSAWDNDISVYVHRRHTARQMASACLCELAAEKKVSRRDRLSTGGLPGKLGASRLRGRVLDPTVWSAPPLPPSGGG